ncbi:MAG: nucleotidyltransferase family protein [Oscillospiraceae bacterium]|nr:nucleotidyltransferase family protein [Oscillospiraceae bacterium]
MTNDEYRKALDAVIRLGACAVNGETPEREWAKGLDTDLLYKAAKQHLLTALVGHALESAGIYEHSFIQAKAKAIRKLGLMDAEMAVLFEKLEQAGIWYVPLKGAVLKAYYPAYGLRQMADHDILFDESCADEVKAIMEDMGFSSENFGTGNDDCYHKEPVCNFELHRSLFGICHETKLQEYYRDVKTRLLPDENNRYGYHFSPEDFYIYMVAHEYKHYSAGGTGLRSLVDTYVYLKKVTLDMDYVAAETEKLGIREFEELNRSLSFHLFGDDKALDNLPDKEAEMLSFVQKCGPYGSMENNIRSRMKKVIGEQEKVTGWMRFKYYLSRLFPTQELLRPWYPLAKYKMCIPLVWIYRIVVIATVRRKKVIREVKIVEKQRKGLN